MITNDTKLALKAMLFIAKETGSGAKAIALGENLFEDAVAPILSRLEASGFIRPLSPGRFELTRPADKIMAGEVVRAIDGPLAPIPCVSHTVYRRCTDCRSEENCEVRRLMRLVRDATAHILDNTSLLDMGAGRNAGVIIKGLGDGRLSAG